MQHVQSLYRQLEEAVSNLVQHIPTVSLIILVSAFALTLSVTVGLFKGSFLILDWYSVIHHYEFHRIITSFLFFGPFSLNWLLFVVVNMQYIITLERGQFLGRQREFVAMLVYIMLCCLAANALIKTIYPSILLFGSVTYVWTRYYPDDRVVVLQLITVRAQYLPLVNIVLSVLQQQSIIAPLVAIAIGHSYWVLDQLVPPVAGFNVFKVLCRAR